MTRAVNIYALSRIRNAAQFDIAERHMSLREESSHTLSHEIESLRRLVNRFLESGVSIEAMDGYFFGYEIEQIGKEFDLLKITDSVCLNIELKAINVGEERILEQLRKNRHYLGHMGRTLKLYTVVTDSLTCYRLEGETFSKVPMEEIVEEVKLRAEGWIEDIDALFQASEYLVSPLTTPERFIRGEYFLTQAQDLVKRSVLSAIETMSEEAVCQILGHPGTGKTLLLYDIGRELSRKGRTAILHCWESTPGQRLISDTFPTLDVHSWNRLEREEDFLRPYRYLLIDEAHRLSPKTFTQLRRLATECGQICVFSCDPEQVLTTIEKRNNITGRIRRLAGANVFELSEKIRTNREITNFINQLRNLKVRPKYPQKYEHVDLCYANTVGEAQTLLSYYKSRGYIFINATKNRSKNGPYAAYEGGYDIHRVIGQEYESVVMVVDDSFYYDGKGRLKGVPRPNPDYIYPNLFYQGVTRVRERLALIVVHAPELYGKMLTVVAPGKNQTKKN